MKNNDDTWTDALRWAFSHSLPWLLLVAAALAPVVAIPAAPASARTAAVSYVTADIPPCDGTQAPDEVCTPSPDPLPTPTPTPAPVDPAPAPPVVTTPPPAPPVASPVPVVLAPKLPAAAPACPVVHLGFRDAGNIHTVTLDGVANCLPVAVEVCGPHRWLALVPIAAKLPGPVPWVGIASPERVVSGSGWASSLGCPSAAQLVAHKVTRPQIARVPIGGIPAGDGSTAMPKMLPRTGPAYPTWAIGLFALGCFALGGLMLLLGNRPAKPLPLRNDAGAISLPALRRTAALVAACLIGSAGTFLAIAQATHQPVTPLVQAVFTPSAEQLDPVLNPTPPAFPKVYRAVVLEPGIAPWSITPGKFYVGSPASNATVAGNPIDPSVWLLPATLTGSDLPGGTVIRVHTAAGTNENCTHSTGRGYGPDGQLAIGDGWSCARLPGSAR